MMIFTVIVQINDLDKEELKVQAESRDDVLKYAIHTYNEYLDKGFIKSYTIKGVE